MSSQPQWKQKYDLLKEYIKTNSEIHIDANEVSIPEHLRDEFYKIFDDIRSAFVDDVFSTLPFEVDTLRKNFIKSEKELTEFLGLDHIVIPVDLSSFLHNPKDGMVRWLYNRLFEMIQDKITVDDFEEMAGNDFASSAGEMFRLGYESWAFLAIILLLEPDEAFAVTLNDNNEPVTAELSEIAFGRQSHHPTKRIPEFIVHSKKLDKYIAFKMPLSREADGYYIPFEIPEKMMRNNTGDTSYVLGSRILFLSVLEDLNKIPIFVDMKTRAIKSPDLIIEFLTEHDLLDSDTISQVQNRIQIMKPKLGSSIVVMNPKQELEDNKPEVGIDTFNAGLDPLKFQPVIDKLA